MLRRIWVSSTGAICGHGQCCVSGLVLQRCAVTVDPDTFAANIDGLFIAGLSAEPNCFQEAIAGQSLDSSTIFECLLGSSVRSVKARVIHGRARANTQRFVYRLVRGGRIFLRGFCGAIFYPRGHE